LDFRPSQVCLFSSQELKSLPRLPLDGVRYVKRKGGICVWEAVGNLLQSSEVELSKFTSFIILTSRLRGPFLPAYVQVRYFSTFPKAQRHAHIIEQTSQPAFGVERLKLASMGASYCPG